jgi:tetratricopeptide (TPR) repeat protein
MSGHSSVSGETVGIGSPRREVAVIRGLFAVLVLVVAVGVAHAQPATNAAAADAALTEGRRFYDVREWDKAIAKFKEAYTLRPDAASLFNLAQSYRLKGDCINAAGFYKTFKRNFPTEKNIDKVDKFIVEMDACAKTQTPVVTAPVVTDPVGPDSVKPQPVATTPEPVVVTQPDSPMVPAPTVTSHRGWMKWTGVALMGAGAIGIGLGTKFALDGSARKDDLQKVCAVSCTSEQALAIEEDGKSANTKAYVFTGIGGALVIGGVVMFVLSRGGDEGTPEVSLAPTSGGATATYSFTF